MGKLLAIIAAVIAVAAGGMFYVDHRDKAAARARDFGPCGVVVVADGRKALEEIAGRLRDARERARVTPRMSLDGPLADLQEQARAARAVTAPACLERARYLLATQADLYAASSRAFMAEADAVTVGAPTITAGRYGDLFAEALRDVAACAPGCSSLPPFEESKEANQLALWRERDRFELQRVSITGRP